MNHKNKHFILPSLKFVIFCTVCTTTSTTVYKYNYKYNAFAGLNVVGPGICCLKVAAVKGLVCRRYRERCALRRNRIFTDRTHPLEVYTDEENSPKASISEMGNIGFGHY